MDVFFTLHGLLDSRQVALIFASLAVLFHLQFSLEYSPPYVDRIWGIWGIWGSCYNIPKAIFYLLKGDYRSMNLLPLAF